MAKPDSTVGCVSEWYSGGHEFDLPVRQHSFAEIGHEIISTAILSLPLIQVGQLSITGERMCTKSSVAHNHIYNCRVLYPPPTGFPLLSKSIMCFTHVLFSQNENKKRKIN